MGNANIQSKGGETRPIVDVLLNQLLICYSMLVLRQVNGINPEKGGMKKRPVSKSEKARKKDTTKLLQKKTSFAEEDTKKKTRKLQKNT